MNRISPTALVCSWKGQGLTSFSRDQNNECVLTDQ
jgi:hypothetical protein